MKLVTKSFYNNLTPSLKAFRPSQNDFDKFNSNLLSYFDRINSFESEENLKTHLMDLFKSMYMTKFMVEQQDRIDFVIRTAPKKTAPAAILFEAKRLSNKSDMIRKDDINRKAFHEILLYYMRERNAGNSDIQKLVVCNEYELYVFESSAFERLFYKNVAFKNDVDAWMMGKKSDVTTEFFYTQIAHPFIAKNETEIDAAYVDLRNFNLNLDGDKGKAELLKLYKFLCPHNLIREPLANDGNSLNKSFYDELLHIIGLEERKEGPKRVIGRLTKAKRNPASLIENIAGQVRYVDGFNSPDIIADYGSSNEDREFNIALELSLTWINRLLFLKLLEAQIFRFHGQDEAYKFLSTKLISDFGDLSDLFFKVLAFNPAERQEHIQTKYGKIPYLNSSLFERTRLEKVIGINQLTNGLELSLFKKTVLKNHKGLSISGKKSTLAYIFDFLDAYDFGSVGDGDLQQDSKTIINAAVLGLIFEKINGYQDGAIFTPGHVTMYMSKMVIEKTVVEAFVRKFPDWKCNDIEDVRNNITDRSKQSILELNKVIDDLKICDPAVGSGHFLVSCLNELIALKSRLGILADSEGNRLSDYAVQVDNDELIIVHSSTDEVFNYRVIAEKVPQGIQHVQKLIFHEKQKLIEGCLFGVDINPNSVKICQLRLWIELLKSAYYRDGVDGQLETLPNIDINIKCGNSLLSRFKLDQSLSDAFKKAKLTVSDYRQMVSDYKTTKDKAQKQKLHDEINSAKTRFQEESLGRLTKEIDATIAKHKAEEAQADLFVLGDADQKQQDEKLALIRKRIDELVARKETLLQNKTFMAALEWRFEFPEVLDDKGQYYGFDIIIANPPYMRIQQIEATQQLQKEYYERDYRSAHGSYDIANLFFELAVKLAKPADSNNIFIFPHKVFNSSNGEPLREYLMNTCAIKHIAHFGANQIFENAITYTCVALFNSVKTDHFYYRHFPLGADVETELARNADFVRLQYKDIEAASKLYGNNQWIFFDDTKGFECFEKIYNNATSLKNNMRAFVGLQTSRDSLYVVKKIAETNNTYTITVNPNQKEEKIPIYTRDFEVEKEFFKPFLMGKDVHRYDTLSTERLVFFPYKLEGKALRVDLKSLEENYPLTFEYVKFYTDVFKGRENGKAEKLEPWYAYIYEKNLVEFEQEKLSAMEICSKQANVAIDRSSIYHSTTVYSLVRNDGFELEYEVLAAIFNSNIFWWFLKLTGDTLQGDARRMKTEYINPFPIPNLISNEDRNLLVDLVTKLIIAKATPLCAKDILALEIEINDAVYSIYGLDNSDKEVIEKSISQYS